jgi:hypothetical protein
MVTTGSPCDDGNACHDCGDRFAAHGISA